MDISAVSNVLNTGGGSIDEKTLGKDDFLKLFILQLSNQDPLNPMNSTEVTSQLAQFTSLEELNNVNSTLSEILAFQHSLQNTMVTNLIGKIVTTPGNTTFLTDKADISYTLSDDAASVKVSIFDETGSLVFSEDTGLQKSGDNIYVWDGQDTFGNQMSEGSYTFEIEARDSSGNPVQALTSSSGTVTGVTFKDGVTYLVLDGEKLVHLSEILSVEGSAL